MAELRIRLNAFELDEDLYAIDLYYAGKLMRYWMWRWGRWEKHPPDPEREADRILSLHPYGETPSLNSSRWKWKWLGG